MKSYKRSYKILVCVAPFVLLAAMCIGIRLFSEIDLGPCWFYALFHLHCPGCGTTRAAKALAQGNIILSLRQNLMLIVSIIIAAMFYIEYVFRVLGKTVKFPLIHSMKFLSAVLIFWGVYSIVRNLVPQIAPF